MKLETDLHPLKNEDIIYNNLRTLLIRDQKLSLE